MPTGAVARVVVAAPGAPERAWVRAIIERSGEYEVVGEAADGRGAIDTVFQHEPEILILDTSMQGSEIIPPVITRCPFTAIVMLGAHDSGPALRVARRLGAAAWISLDQSPDRILHTLRLAPGMQLVGVPLSWRSVHAPARSSR